MFVYKGRVGRRSPVIRTEGDDVVHVVRRTDDGAPHHRLRVFFGGTPGLFVQYWPDLTLSLMTFGNYSTSISKLSQRLH